MGRAVRVCRPLDAQLVESNNGDPSAMDEDDLLMQRGGPVAPAEFEELGVRHMDTHRKASKSLLTRSRLLFSSCANHLAPEAFSWPEANGRGGYARTWEGG